jgi:23S rRNA (uracil1939-C5)-methyltransferase
MTGPPAFEFSPQKLVYGGDALGYHEGRTVLVPRALPGERLEVEELRVAKGVVHARPRRVLAAAPERAEPPCPYFGRCGGCHYQHLADHLQAAAKSEILRETLRRIGKLAWEDEIPIHAARPWSYRNQAQLKVATDPDNRGALGFFEAESHRLVPVDACLILSPRLNAVLAELRRQGILSRLAGTHEIELLADDHDEQVMITLRGIFGSREIDILAQDLLASLPGVTTVAVQSTERGNELKVYGQPSLVYRVSIGRVGDFGYRVSPGSFFQASRFLIPQLVSAVAAYDTPNERGLVLDLYAGVGLLSLPLARTFAEVVAVESNRTSAADLAANVRAHGLVNLRAVNQSVFDFVRRFARGAPDLVVPDLVVLDPPRAGVEAPVLKLLAALRPRYITYVSCHPSTLARDLRYLAAHGYRLTAVELFDFFAQTFHIEALIRLARDDLASA